MNQYHLILSYFTCLFYILICVQTPFKNQYRRYFWCYVWWFTVISLAVDTLKPINKNLKEKLSLALSFFFFTYLIVNIFSGEISYVFNLARLEKSRVATPSRWHRTEQEWSLFLSFFFSFAFVIVHFLCRVSRVLIHGRLVTRALISILIETLSRRYYTAINVVLCLSVPLFHEKIRREYSRIGKRVGYKIRYFTMTVQGSMSFAPRHITLLHFSFHFCENKIFLIFTDLLL